jgi:hypothetical protein
MEWEERLGEFIFFDSLLYRAIQREPMFQLLTSTKYPKGSDATQRSQS